MATSTVAAERARAPVQDGPWLRAARRARLLSWLSLAWMTAEGAVGLLAGARAGSIALVGWGVGSAIEGLAASIVIWRFTGSRTHSATSERRAQRAVAVSFLLLAPYVAVEAIHALATSEHPSTSWLGIAVTASSVLLMPVLGVAKHRLGRQLDSGATAGEGTQNLICAGQGLAVLLGLGANAAVGAWWLDGAIALGLAGLAVHEGIQAWRGEGCCVSAPLLGGAEDRCSDDCCTHELGKIGGGQVRGAEGTRIPHAGAAGPAAQGPARS
jgi:divalent metal cation (Fe/Co/Zn/Cd) transporter